MAETTTVFERDAITLYEHGAGRTASTEQHDDYKVGREYVPRERLDAALAEIERLSAPPASGEGRTPREVYAHDLEQPIWDAYLTEHPLADEAPDHWPQWLIAATQAVEGIVNRRSRPEPRAGHHWAPFACGCGARWTEELPLPTDTESVAAVVCGKCAAELLSSAPEAEGARGRLRADEMRGLDDLTRHIMDGLELAADQPDTRAEQAAIKAALLGWFATREDGGDA